MPNRVQTLRSSVAGNIPQPGTQPPGSLWLNFADYALGFIDAGQTAQRFLAVRWFVSTANYAVGDFVLYSGNLYRAVAASSAGGFVAANWARVGTTTDTALMQAYVDAADALRLPLAGGTMTGPLILAADPTVALGATTKQYVDLRSGAVTVGATPPASPNPGALWWDSVGGQLYVWYVDPSTSQWVIAVSAASMAGGYLPLSGGAMTGDLILNANPTAALGAVTKQYADAGDAARLPITGGSVLGNLTIAPSGGGYVALQATTGATLVVNKLASGAQAAIVGLTNNVTRWNMQLGDTTGEGGSNGGSNFALNRYNDAGTFIDAPFKSVRSSGVVIIGGARSGSGLGAGNGVSWDPGNGMVVETGANANNTISTNRASAGLACSFYYGGGAGGNISQAAGGVCSFNTGSDVRLKQDEQSFDAGPILDQIEVYNFEWTTAPGVRAYGVMAQECNEVFPDAVYHHEPDDTWSVDYSKFVPLLLQEIKTLRERVSALEGAR